MDKECVDAFLQAFPLPHFLTLGEDSFEKTLWEKIPRIKQELSFAQIEELASFFAQIVDYKSPFTNLFCHIMQLYICKKSRQTLLSGLFAVL